MDSRKELKVIYFLGIGGIGMSALARYFNSQGKKVAGYDLTPSNLTNTLISEGMSISFSLEDSTWQNADLVVYTPAIKSDSPLFQKISDSGIEMRKRSEVLGDISKDNHTIAVCGTHGKTSVSSILAYILNEAQLPAYSFIGGILSNYNTNYIEGISGYILTEADEFDRSLLKISPDAIIITAIEPDHLDIYSDFDDILKTYREFIKKLNPLGVLVYHHSLEKYLHDILPNKSFSYGIKSGQIQAQNIRNKGFTNIFDFQNEDYKITNLQLNLPGKHNIENAIAAIGMALERRISPHSISENLKNFTGIKRRFEKIYESAQKIIVDDYAHHPTEVKAAIESMKQLFPEKRLLTAFHPHLYSRTNDFYQEFAEALELSDELVVLDIYPAREKPMDGVSSNLISDLIQKPVERCRLDELPAIIEKKLDDFDALLLLGAGNINTKIPDILSFIEQN